MSWSERRVSSSQNSCEPRPTASHRALARHAAHGRAQGDDEWPTLLNSPQFAPAAYRGSAQRLPRCERFGASVRQTSYPSGDDELADGGNRAIFFTGVFSTCETTPLASRPTQGSSDPPGETRLRADRTANRGWLDGPSGRQSPAKITCIGGRAPSPTTAPVGPHAPIRAGTATLPTISFSERF
jgi:hypothetical protein